MGNRGASSTSCLAEACRDCSERILESMSSCGPLAFLQNEAALRQNASGAAMPAVLVLGGSTFMGRETVHAFLELPARVCVVNRGRSYWGTRDPSNGRVARVTADRRDKPRFAEHLDAVTTKLQENWALVADFSAYDGADMKCALEGLRGRFDTYAYISSDSVYEVSAAAGTGWMHGVTIDERFSQRPADEALRKKLRKADSYGDGKLEAEEALAAGLESNAGVALRLPDVIGPFDDTFRLWAYWHWLRAGPDNPPQVRKLHGKRPRLDTPAPTSSEDPPLAFVFSRDVARFLVHLMHRRLDSKFDAVNVGCDLQVPLREFLELLNKASSTGGVTSSGGVLQLSEVDRPRGFLPSVNRPLPLDFQHLKSFYGFEPTPLPEVLQISADWFRAACKEFPEEAAEAVMKLPAAARHAALAAAELSPPKGTGSSSDESSSSSSRSS